MKNKKSLWNLLLSMLLVVSLAAGCGSNSSNSPVQPSEVSAALYKAGTYTGEGTGNNGSIKVEVTFDDNAITSVKVLEHSETAGLSDPAIERIPAKIVDGQTLSVDAVSGATKTSDGILEAVADCVSQAGGDLAALKASGSKTSTASGQTIEKNVDLLIIGGGGAGLTAANAALENGVENILLIEKNASFSGATAVAGGLAGGNSELQESFGITDDSPELIYQDIMRGGKEQNDAPLVALWSQAMGPTVDWLIQDMGVPIEKQFSNFPEHTVQRSYYVTGGSGNMLAILGEKFTKDGGEIMMDTKATDLRMDGDRVIGAVAQDIDGNTINITAKATLLATGGFGNNPDMLSDKLSVALFYGASSSTGEGILMAEKAGAKLTFMDYAKMYPQGIEVSPGFARVSTVHSMLTTQETGAIYVNKEGKRVINENMDFVSIKDITKEQTDNIIFLVMDQNAYDKWSVLAHGDKDSSAAGRFTFEEQEQWFTTPGGVPIFRRGDNLAEVAAAAGIDGAALKATIDNWNEEVSAGKDSEFGRTQLFNLSTDGTYYIIEQKLRFATTLGGVSLTEGFEVKNNQDQPIPGFYAAGECVGGVHGVESMPTCMLSWAVTSGKLAGEAISEALK